MTQVDNPLDKNETSRTEFSIDLEDDYKILTSEDLKRIGDYFVYDESGNRHQMSELWAEFKTIFIFVRVCFFI